jgi:hypothetical protein
LEEFWNFWVIRFLFAYRLSYRGADRLQYHPWFDWHFASIASWDMGSCILD